MFLTWMKDQGFGRRKGGIIARETKMAKERDGKEPKVKTKLGFWERVKGFVLDTIVFGINLAALFQMIFE